MLLPAPFPDETLYGLIARTNRLGGDITAEATSQRLFGHPTAGLRHDLPCHLDHLSRATHGLLGDALAISSKLTTLPYFLRFKPPAIELQAYTSVTDLADRHLKHQLGLPPSPSRASLPLYACPQCMKEDSELYGVASWRRSHQLPGSVLCPIHSEQLLEVPSRLNRYKHGVFALPEDVPLVESHASVLQDDRASATLLRIARLNRDILENHLPQPYQRALLPQVYRHGLRTHGLLTRGGLVRAKEYVRWLHDHFGAIRNVRPFSYALSNVHEYTLLRAVRKPRADFHPLYHALLIDAIFGGWERFAQAYAWEACMETQAAIPPLPPPEITNVPQHVGEFVKALNESLPEISIRTLASQHGMDISTGMRWAGKLGVSDLPRRPKILHHTLKSAIVEALLKGEPQRDIAKKTGLSRATVDRVCQERPGLHEAWRQANHERKRTAARNVMLAYLQEYPRTTLADARLLSPPGYCWLRRHDSEWLQLALPKTKSSVTPREIPNRSIVDWQARDHLCFEHLTRLAGSVVFQPWERIKPGVLLGKLPTLPFLPRLERLPRSKALTNQILREHNAKRAQFRRSN